MVSEVVAKLFTALHHFHPEDAREILAEAANKSVPTAAFESQQRSVGKTIAVPIALFLGAFLLTPFLGRMTLGRFIFTCMIPLAPLFFAWDGAISCLRTYTPRELGQPTENLTQNGYQWEVGLIPAIGPMGEYNITYLVGYPRRAELDPAI